jgi:MazG family protein
MAKPARRSASAADRIGALIGAAGIEPAAGLQVVDAARLPGAPFDPGLPLLVLRPDPGTPTASALPGRHARSGALGVLRSLYPHRQPVRRLDDGAALTLDDLDEAGLAKSDWLIEPLPAHENLASPHGMAAISARLRAPDGCPWDRRQDHMSLRPYVIEEAYETVEAIERGRAADLADELGDLFVQIVLHAQLAAEAGDFDLTDVYRAIAAKIVRRHPHVFEGLEVSGVEQVLANWETIKATERADTGREQSAFAGIARALPALHASREIQERASNLGWDWPAIEGVWEKVGEELDELRRAAAGTSPERMHEVGDLLFALVNLARWLRIDPEEALRAANRRWIQRYREVEALAVERGLDLAAMDAETKDRLWDEVKAATSDAGPQG